MWQHRAVSSLSAVADGRRTESVWDYPRLPALEPCERRVRIELGGVTIADSVASLRVLETSHPPTISTRAGLTNERVQPQAGDFYGGCVTAGLRGPFKGAAGTAGC